MIEELEKVMKTNFNFNFLPQVKYKLDEQLKNETVWDEVNE